MTRAYAGETIKASHIHDNVNRYGVDAVGTDDYAITPDPVIESYVAGMHFSFKAGVANTGACTLNVNGKGAKTIKKNVSDDLVTGDILIGQIVEVVYDGTNMQMISNINPIIETTIGATHSLTTVAGQKVIVWAKGTQVGNASNTNISLKYNGVTKDSLTALDVSSDDQTFSLMYTETPGAGTANITVTTDQATLRDVVIIVMKIG